MNTPDIENIYQELQQIWGLDFARIRRLVADLDEWQTHDGLVDKHALSHRGIGQVLHLIEPWLEKQEEHLRLAPAHCDDLQTLFAPGPLAAQFPADITPDHPALTPLRTALADRPHPDRHLDHVAATPETLLKRALFVATTYETAQAQVLCLGDHDLTSFALAATCPEMHVTVVDVDEQLLAFIDKTARERDWNIKTYFADLRLELPASLETHFDLVFTDPPYSPAGVKLFLQRSIAALSDHPFSRILLAYGFGEQHPGLGYKVQTALHELRLVYEAILPHFNHYHGARAIGAQSALYVLRPTRRSRPAAERIAATANIYTHGRSSEEAENPLSLEGPVKIAQDWQENETTLVGESWPKDIWPKAKRVDLADYLAACRTGDQPRTRNLALQLHPHFDTYLIRLLLSAQAESILVTVHHKQAKVLYNGAPLHPIIACKYRLVDKATQQQLVSILLQKIPTPRDHGPAFLLRYLADHAKARLGNAWREGLIAWYKSKDSVLTKNQARDLICQGAIGSAYGQSYLTELPLHLLSELVGEIEPGLKEVL